MSTITKERAAGIANGEKCYTHDDVVELARIALASLELERGMIRRFDLDMSDCDSCGQDCGADMVEDLDGEYVLWDEVLPHLYRHDEYTAPPAPVSVPEPIKRNDADGWWMYKGRRVGGGCAEWYNRALDDCRAVMLQGADGNSPVIPDDVRRMDWLVSKTVNVREPMVYGSHSLFWSQTITDEEDDYYATKLREQIDAAMEAEIAAAPQQEVKNG